MCTRRASSVKVRNRQASHRADCRRTSEFGRCSNLAKRRSDGEAFLPRITVLLHPSRPRPGLHPGSYAGPVSARLRSLRAAPATVPALAALAVFVWWAADQGGQPVTVWGPGALLLIALLAVAVWLVPLNWAGVPRALRVATIALGAFTAWSYASIAWAADPGAALDGANRTLLYLVVFALFALWPQRPPTAGLLLGAWTLALIVLAVVTDAADGRGRSARPVPRRPPRLPGGLPQRQRRDLPDGAVAGRSRSRRRARSRGPCAGCSPAAPSSWPSSGC